MITIKFPLNSFIFTVISLLIIYVDFFCEEFSVYLSRICPCFAGDSLMRTSKVIQTIYFSGSIYIFVTKILTPFQYYSYYFTPKGLISNVHQMLVLRPLILNCLIQRY